MPQQQAAKLQAHSSFGTETPACKTPSEVKDKWLGVLIIYKLIISFRPIDSVDSESGEVIVPHARLSACSFWAPGKRPAVESPLWASLKHP